MKNQGIFILIFCLLCSAVTAVSGKEPSDAKKPDYIYTLVSQLHLYEESLPPAQEMNKAEFLKTVLRLTQPGYDGSSDEEILEDAYQKGLIRVRENGNLTLAAALKILVDALGRQVQAEAAGGYPLGYVITAKSLSLLSGMGEDMNAALCVADCARLIYNSLEVERYYSYNANGATNISKTGDTFLSKRGLVRLEGTVTAVNSGQNRLENKITLLYTYQDYDNVQDDFYCDAEKSKQALCCRAVVFACDFNLEDAYTIKAFAIKDTNQRLEIAGKDYLAFDSTHGSLKYSNQGEEECTAKIRVDAAVYLNEVLQNKGLPVLGSMLEVFASVTNTSPYRTYGKFSLIDREDDGVYDAIIITRYLDYLVSFVNLNTFTIYDKFRDSTLTLDESALKNKNIVIVNEKGETKMLRDAAKAKIISVASRDEESVMTQGTIVVCGNVLTGKADGLQKMTDFHGQITLAGADYDYYVTKNQTSQDFLDYGMSAGDEGKFYTNALGDIVYKDTKSALSTNYAMLTVIGKTQGIGSEVQLRMLTAAGEWITGTVADSLTFYDGSSDTQKLKLSNEQIAGQLLANSEQKKVLRPVTYKLNADGKIGELSYAYPNTDKKPIKQVFTMDRQFNKPDGANAASYSARSQSMGDAYFTGATVIFAVNSYSVTDYLGQASAALKEEELSVIKAEDIPPDYDGYCEGYSIQDGNNLNMAVMFGVNPRDELLPYFSVVKEVGFAANAQGETAFRLICYENGEKKEYFTEQDTDIYYDSLYFPADEDNEAYFQNIRTVRPNDVIAYEKNARGELRNVRVLLRTEKVKGYYPAVYEEAKSTPVADLNLQLPVDATASGEQIHYYFGLVTAKYMEESKNKLTLTVNDDRILVRDPIDNGDFTYDQKKKLTATLPVPADLKILRMYHDGIREILFADIAADVQKGDVRSGDLVFIKTVNGMISDLFLIGVEP